MAQHGQGAPQHHCKDCGLFFESGKSLDVHLQYHHENLMNKWGLQAGGGGGGHAAASHTQIAPPPDESNNNTYKGESVSAPADSSDMMKAAQQFGQQPPYPPFQDGHRFSPHFFVNKSPTPNGLNFGGAAPNAPQQPAPEQFLRPPSNSSIKQEFFKQEEPEPVNGNNTYILGGASDDFPTLPTARSSSTPNSGPPPSPSQSGQVGVPTAGSFRYHPYSMPYAPADRNMVSSSSPVQRPSPSSSPQHCEKCGAMCVSREALREHLVTVHGFQHFPPYRPPGVKDDGEAQILDLDSQKVHVYQPSEEEEAAMRQQQQQQQQHSHPHHPGVLNWMEQSGQGAHLSPMQHWQRNGGVMAGLAPPGLAAPPPPAPPHFNPQHGMTVPQPAYQHRPYLPQESISSSNVNGLSPGMAPQMISSSQVPNPMSPSLSADNGSKANSSKGNASWKSNEARRPKTYHCSACNKWFTSSGHLKRHYNTTLHKNAVKQSGAPDPASLPVSTHHHPERDANKSNGVNKRATPVALDSSGSPAPSSIGGEESSPSDDATHSNGFGRTTPVQAHPGLAPPHPGNLMNSSGSPNRVAGPSDTPSGGLHSMYNDLTPQAPPPQQPQHHFLGVGLHPTLPPSLHPIHQVQGGAPPGFMGPTSMGLGLGMGELQSRQTPTMAPSPSMTAYPNDLPPHASSQVTHSINHSLTSTTGSALDEAQGPLPSFAMFNSFNVEYDAYHPNAGFMSVPGNVGGLGPSPMTDTVILVAQPPPQLTPQLPQQLPPQLPQQLPQQLPPQLPQQLPPQLQLPPQEQQPPTQPLQPLPAEVRGNDGCHLRIVSSYSIKNEQPDEIKLDDSFSDESSNPLDVEQPNSPADYPTSTDDILQEKENHLVIDESGRHLPKRGRRRFKRKVREDNNSNLISSSTTPGKQDNSAATNTSGGIVFNSSMISEGNLHKCLDCDKQFNKACYLTQHNKSFHAGDKPFKCDRCGKRFTAENLHRAHLSKHAGDKPYKCEICPKQFNHKTDLRRHQCLHTGEKPFACPICGKGFIRKDHMVKHHDTHNKRPGNGHRIRIQPTHKIAF